MDRHGDEPLMDQLRRERLLDMEERIGRIRRQAFAVLSLGVIAAGPWIGFEFVIPLALLLVGFWFALPVATLGARFEPRGVRMGIAWTLFLLLVVTVGLDTATVLERPDPLI